MKAGRKHESLELWLQAPWADAENQIHVPGKAASALHPGSISSALISAFVDNVIIVSPLVWFLVACVIWATAVCYFAL